MADNLSLPIVRTIVKDVNNLRSEVSRLSVRNFNILAFQHIENVLKVLINDSSGTIYKTHHLGTLFVQVERLYPGSFMFVRSRIITASQFDKLLATNYLDLRYSKDIKAVVRPEKEVYLEVLYALLEICVNYEIT